MAKIKIDLHAIFNKNKEIENVLIAAIDEAVECKIGELEIIHGKGIGQLKKRVLRFLDQKHIKAQYSRIDKDSKNFGRTFVFFKH